MKGFLISKWITILIVLAVLFDFGFLALTHQWVKLRTHAYKLMLAVEKSLAGSATGQEKFDIVFKKIYSLLPAWLRLFITPNILKKKLQKWYNLMMDSLDDGIINNSNETNTTRIL